jgi:hypothetical protein
LEIELLDAKGYPCIRLQLDSTGYLSTKVGYRNKNVFKYSKGEPLHITISLNCKNRFYSMSVNGKPAQNYLCFAPVQSVERIAFRTGVVRRFPDADTPTDQDFDLKGTEEKEKEAVFEILGLEVKN